MNAFIHFFDRTDAFEAFCAQASLRRGLWRVVGTGLLFVGLLIILSIAVGYAAAMAVPGVREDIDALLASRTGTLIILASFLLWPVTLAIALRIFHRRGLRTLINPQGRIHTGRYWKGFVLTLTISLLGFVVGAMIVGAPTRAEVGLTAWAMLAAPAFVLLMVQTGAEEMVFRGYLQQQLGARFRSAWIWAVLPSVVFGALHWNPGAYGAGAVLAIVATGLFGLILAVVTARTGDLSLAMGLHLGVNTPAILFVSPESYLSGLALYHWPQGDVVGALLWLDIALIAGVGLAAIALTRQR